MDKFIDRRNAGWMLARKLKTYTNNPSVIVLALPRGGVPVGYEVAKALNAPLDVLIVRKLGFPAHEELAMGAITNNNTTIFNEDLLKESNVSKEQIQQVIEFEKKELKRRELLYRKGKAFPDLKGKIIILVDDGIATGATILSAIKSLRQHNPLRIILAIPVAPPSVYLEIKNKVDEIICLLQPANFNAVGLWYEDFAQTSDEEVAELLQKSKHNYSQSLQGGT